MYAFSFPGSIITLLSCCCLTCIQRKTEYSLHFLSQSSPKDIFHAPPVTSRPFPWSPVTHLTSWNRVSLPRPLNSLFLGGQATEEAKPPLQLGMGLIWFLLFLRLEKERPIYWCLYAKSVLENHREITSITYFSTYNIYILLNATKARNSASQNQCFLRCVFSSFPTEKWFKAA